MVSKKRIYINGRFAAFQAVGMSSNLIVRKFVGDITQLVECMLCKYEVVGSNPVISINYFLDDVTQW